MVFKGLSASFVRLSSVESHVGVPSLVGSEGLCLVEVKASAAAVEEEGLASDKEGLMTELEELIAGLEGLKAELEVLRGGLEIL